MAKPKLLLISAIAPFPKTGGGAVRMYYTLKYLSRKYEIYFLTFGEKVKEVKQKEFLDRYCRSWQVFPLRSRSFGLSLPYYFSCWQSLAMKLAMEALINKYKFAKVRIEFSQMMAWVKNVPKTIKTEFVAHDISTVSFARRAKEQQKIVRKIYDYFNWWQVKNFEKKWWRKYDQIVTVSQNDREVLQREFDLTKVKVERNGLGQLNFLPSKMEINIDESKKIKFGYIGAFTHPPNKAAVEKIVKKIMPALDQKKIPYQFILAGENMGEISFSKMVNLGVVADAKDFFEKIEMLVAPIGAGSGTRIKVLESLSFGVPVVTSVIGAEGLQIDHPYLKIVTKEQWLQAIVEMKSLRGRLAKNESEKMEMEKELARQLEPYLWENTFKEV